MSCSWKIKLMGLCVPACLVMLSMVLSVSTIRAQEPALEPALNLPVREQPMEPGDIVRMMESMVPRSDLRYTKKTMNVLNTKIAYVDEGSGNAIVFVHGAPESSYIWRNIMPYLEAYGRIVAFDLPGHGDSGKPDIDYTISDYLSYVKAIMEELDLGNDIVFVVHDWGSVLGLDWARKNSSRVKGVAMMETVAFPFYPILDTKEAVKRIGKAGAVHHYEKYHVSPEQSYDLAVIQNEFIEGVLQLHTYRELSQREMDAYRAPFRTLESRKPLTMWAAEVGLDGNRPVSDKAMLDNNEWMKETDTQFLEVYASPGEVAEEFDVATRVKHIKNIETAYIGHGLHFVQEDQPVAIGRAIADWYRRHFAKDSTKWFTNPQGGPPAR